MKMMSWSVSTQLLAMGYVMMKTTMLIATLMVGIVVQHLLSVKGIGLVMGIVMMLTIMKNVNLTKGIAATMLTPIGINIAPFVSV